METSLKSIKQQLQQINTNLAWHSEQVASTRQGVAPVLNISGLDSVRSSINKLESLQLFDSIIQKLKVSAIFTTASNAMSVQVSEGNDIVSTLLLLKTVTENFLNVLTNTVPEESMDSINIKLPEVRDFSELSIISRDIHIALSQVLFNDEIQGETKIISVENGSIWFNVFVGSIAVSVVASLAWSAAVIYKKILEGKLLGEQVRGLKIKNDSLEDISKAQQAMVDLLIQAEAEHINSEHFKETEAENIERIKNSIKLLADLIGRGAEIHPALVAPENVSNLFPDTHNLIGLESKIKKLTN